MVPIRDASTPCIVSTKTVIPLDHSAAKTIQDVMQTQSILELYVLI